MTRILVYPLSLFLLATPSLAQEPSASDDGEFERGFELLGEGAELLFRGLRDEAEPSLRDMVEALRDLNWNGLTFRDIDDYHPPEVLPNGDIIIRRKVPLDPMEQADPDGDGEVDL
ncbi:MAG: AAA+ family ATPase [Rhodobacteraceae bacterium]|nr:AAA+ family ATPase [Paracoccaceae bacterium]